jgi:predicted AAA+ superfamily ATPase
MRPLSLAERGVDKTTVPMSDFLKGIRPAVAGEAAVDLDGYVDEILRSGFPAIRKMTGRALRAQLRSYLDRVVDKDFEEVGHSVRDPELLKRWIRAYAAAASTTASLETIRDAASPGEAGKPTKDTVMAYRAALERLWLLEPVPAWTPTRNRLNRLTRPDKHQLADPALSVAALGLTREALLQGEDGRSSIPRDGTLLGHLFESLVTQSCRVYAQANESDVYHFRTKGGRQEIDLIVVRPDQRVLAVEVKLSRTVKDDDVRHLLWLREKLGPDLLDMVVVNAGPFAFRRDDGVAVVPASLLGP